MPAHVNIHAPYHAWYAKYRQYKTKRTQNQIRKDPVTTSVCLERKTHLRMIRFGNREWITGSAIMNAALIEFLDKHGA